MAELAPRLIGLDPTQLSLVNQAMDSAMRGHPYVKSAIDMACWDILGKVSGLPVVSLLGGRFGETLLFIARSLRRHPRKWRRWWASTVARATPSSN